ncbi:UvrD-helicase domain-containing protein [Nocardia sp. alder85J]|uniref:UvrD-helicase domain-containing protein n=1 Tax=Nocardia sp. alder85J TaxID=2862949 RepID=UPI0022594916|nr:UvrD-helicase domain-containing protein [Nocardia sp. alder85J]MCX4097711.1 AAA family ATPase [Nocardia sp. alder85J]
MAIGRAQFDAGHLQQGPNPRDHAEVADVLRRQHRHRRTVEWIEKSYRDGWYAAAHEVTGAVWTTIRDGLARDPRIVDAARTLGMSPEYLAVTAEFTDLVDLGLQRAAAADPAAAAAIRVARYVYCYTTPHDLALERLAADIADHALGHARRGWTSPFATEQDLASFRRWAAAQFASDPLMSVAFGWRPDRQRAEDTRTVVAMILSELPHQRPDLGVDLGDPDVAARVKADLFWEVLPSLTSSDRDTVWYERRGIWHPGTRDVAVSRIDDRWFVRSEDNSLDCWGVDHRAAFAQALILSGQRARITPEQGAAHARVHALRTALADRARRALAGHELLHAAARPSRSQGWVSYSRLTKEAVRTVLDTIRTAEPVLVAAAEGEGLDAAEWLRDGVAGAIVDDLRRTHIAAGGRDDSLFEPVPLGADLYEDTTTESVIVGDRDGAHVRITSVGDRWTTSPDIGPSPATLTDAITRARRHLISSNSAGIQQIPTLPAVPADSGAIPVADQIPIAELFAGPPMSPDGADDTNFTVPAETQPVSDGEPTVPTDATVTITDPDTTAPELGNDTDRAGGDRCPDASDFEQSGADALAVEALGPTPTPPAAEDDLSALVPYFGVSELDRSLIHCTVADWSRNCWGGVSDADMIASSVVSAYLRDLTHRYGVRQVHAVTAELLAANPRYPTTAWDKIEQRAQARRARADQLIAQAHSLRDAGAYDGALRALYQAQLTNSEIIGNQPDYHPDTYATLRDLIRTIRDTESGTTSPPPDAYTDPRPPHPFRSDTDLRSWRDAAIAAMDADPLVSLRDTSNRPEPHSHLLDELIDINLADIAEYTPQLRDDLTDDYLRYWITAATATLFARHAGTRPDPSWTVDYRGWRIADSNIAVARTAGEWRVVTIEDRIGYHDGWGADHRAAVAEACLRAGRRDLLPPATIEVHTRVAAARKALAALAAPALLKHEMMHAIARSSELIGNSFSRSSLSGASRSPLHGTAIRQVIDHVRTQAPRVIDDLVATGIDPAGFLGDQVLESVLRDLVDRYRQPANDIDPLGADLHPTWDGTVLVGDPDGDHIELDSRLQAREKGQRRGVFLWVDATGRHDSIRETSFAAALAKARALHTPRTPRTDPDPADSEDEEPADTITSGTTPVIPASDPELDDTPAARRPPSKLERALGLIAPHETYVGYIGPPTPGRPRERPPDPVDESQLGLDFTGSATGDEPPPAPDSVPVQPADALEHIVTDVRLPGGIDLRGPRERFVASGRTWYSDDFHIDVGEVCYFVHRRGQVLDERYTVERPADRDPAGPPSWHRTGERIGTAATTTQIMPMIRAHRATLTDTPRAPAAHHDAASAPHWLNQAVGIYADRIDENNPLARLAALGNLDLFLSTFGPMAVYRQLGPLYLSVANDPRFRNTDTNVLASAAREPFVQEEFARRLAAAVWDRWSRATWSPETEAATRRLHDNEWRDLGFDINPSIERIGDLTDISPTSTSLGLTIEAGGYSFQLTATGEHLSSITARDLTDRATVAVPAPAGRSGHEPGSAMAAIRAFLRTRHEADAYAEDVRRHRITAALQPIRPAIEPLLRDSEVLAAVAGSGLVRDAPDGRPILDRALHAALTKAAFADAYDQLGGIPALAQPLAELADAGFDAVEHLRKLLAPALLTQLRSRGHVPADLHVINHHTITVGASPGMLEPRIVLTNREIEYPRGIWHSHSDDGDPAVVSEFLHTAIRQARHLLTTDAGPDHAPRDRPPVSVSLDPDTITEPVAGATAPVKLDGEKFAPSPQQQAVYDAVLAGRTVKIQAGAGAGKTSTLRGCARRIGEADPDARIIYLAFNKTVQLEADRDMPANVESRTGHSVAVVWGGRHRQARLNDKTALRKPPDIAAHLRLTSNLAAGRDAPLTPAEQALAASRTVDVYATSADDDIGRQHLPERLSGLPPASREKLLSTARAVWVDLVADDGRLRLTHDHIRKMWALSRPDFSRPGAGLQRPATVVFLDEAQDTAPVLQKVVSDQHGVQKVIVGDENQAIYAFTGAVNALAELDADQTLPLTTSYRFGPAIATMGNAFLQLLGTEMRIEGGGPESEIVEPGTLAAPDAILVRSNSGAITEIARELGAGRVVGVPKGTKGDLTALVDTARYLKGLRSLPTRIHDDLAPYRTWDEVVDQADRGDDPKIAMLARIVDRTGLDNLDQLVQSIHELGAEALPGVRFRDAAYGLVAEGQTYGSRHILARAGFLHEQLPGGRILKKGPNAGKPEKAWIAFGTPAERQAALDRARELAAVPTPDVVVSTAHKAKGLEWDSVRIGEDFKNPATDPDSGELVVPPAEELRLAYVAITRARRALDPGTLAYVFDLTNTEPGPATTPAAAPGIEVEREPVEDVGERAETERPATGTTVDPGLGGGAAPSGDTVVDPVPGDPVADQDEGDRYDPADYGLVAVPGADRAIDPAQWGWHRGDHQPGEGAVVEEWHRGDWHAAIPWTADDNLVTPLWLQHETIVFDEDSHPVPGVTPWEQIELTISTAAEFREVLAETGRHGWVEASHRPGLWQLTATPTAAMATAGTRADPSRRQEVFLRTDDNTWCLAATAAPVPLAPPVPIVPPITDTAGLEQFVLGRHRRDPAVKKLVTTVLSGRTRAGVDPETALRQIAAVDHAVYQRTAVAATADRIRPRGPLDVAKARNALQRWAAGDPTLTIPNPPHDAPPGNQTTADAAPREHGDATPGTGMPEPAGAATTALLTLDQRLLLYAVRDHDIVDLASPGAAERKDKTHEQIDGRSVPSRVRIHRPHWDAAVRTYTEYRLDPRPPNAPTINGATLEQFLRTVSVQLLERAADADQRVRDAAIREAFDLNEVPAADAATLFDLGADARSLGELDRHPDGRPTLGIEAGGRRFTVRPPRDGDYGWEVHDTADPTGSSTASAQQLGVLLTGDVMAAIRRYLTVLDGTSETDSRTGTAALIHRPDSAAMPALTPAAASVLTQDQRLLLFGAESPWSLAKSLGTDSDWYIRYVAFVHLNGALRAEVFDHRPQWRAFRYRQDRSGVRLTAADGSVPPGAGVLVTPAQLKAFRRALDPRIRAQLANHESLGEENLARLTAAILGIGTENPAPTPHPSAPSRTGPPHPAAVPQLPRSHELLLDHARSAGWTLDEDIDTITGHRQIIARNESAPGSPALMLRWRRTHGAYWFDDQASMLERPGDHGPQIVQPLTLTDIAEQFGLLTPADDFSLPAHSFQVIDSRWQRVTITLDPQERYHGHGASTTWHLIDTDTAGHLIVEETDFTDGRGYHIHTAAVRPRPDGSTSWEITSSVASVDQPADIMPEIRAYGRQRTEIFPGTGTPAPTTASPGESPGTSPIAPAPPAPGTPAPPRPASRPSLTPPARPPSPSTRKGPGTKARPPRRKDPSQLEMFDLTADEPIVPAPTGTPPTSPDHPAKHPDPTSTAPPPAPAPAPEPVTATSAPARHDADAPAQTDPRTAALAAPFTAVEVAEQLRRFNAATFARLIEAIVNPSRDALTQFTSTEHAISRHGVTVEIARSGLRIEARDIAAAGHPIQREVTIAWPQLYNHWIRPGLTDQRRTLLLRAVELSQHYRTGLEAFELIDQRPYWARAVGDMNLIAEDVRDDILRAAQHRDAALISPAALARMAGQLDRLAATAPAAWVATKPAHALQPGDVVGHLTGGVFAVQQVQHFDSGVHLQGLRLYREHGKAVCAPDTTLLDSRDHDPVATVHLPKLPLPPVTRPATNPADHRVPEPDDDAVGPAAGLFSLADSGPQRSSAAADRAAAPFTGDEVAELIQRLPNRTVSRLIEALTSTDPQLLRQLAKEPHGHARGGRGVLMTPRGLRLQDSGIHTDPPSPREIVIPWKTIHQHWFQPGLSGDRVATLSHAVTVRNRYTGGLTAFTYVRRPPLWYRTQRELDTTAGRVLRDILHVALHGEDHTIADAAELQRTLRWVDQLGTVVPDEWESEKRVVDLRPGDAVPHLPGGRGGLLVIQQPPSRSATAVELRGVWLHYHGDPPEPAVEVIDTTTQPVVKTIGLPAVPMAWTAAPLAADELTRYQLWHQRVSYWRKRHPWVDPAGKPAIVRAVATGWAAVEADLEPGLESISPLRHHDDDDDIEVVVTAGHQPYLVVAGSDLHIKTPSGDDTRTVSRLRFRDAPQILSVIRRDAANRSAEHAWDSVHPGIGRTTALAATMGAADGESLRYIDVDPYGALLVMLRVGDRTFSVLEPSINDTLWRVREGSLLTPDIVTASSPDQLLPSLRAHLGLPASSAAPSADIPATAPADATIIAAGTGNDGPAADPDPETDPAPTAGAQPPRFGSVAAARAHLESGTRDPRWRTPPRTHNGVAVRGANQADRAKVRIDTSSFRRGMQIARTAELSPGGHFLVTREGQRTWHAFHVGSGTIMTLGAGFDAKPAALDFATALETGCDAAGLPIDWAAPHIADQLDMATGRAGIDLAIQRGRQQAAPAEETVRPAACDPPPLPSVDAEHPPPHTDSTTPPEKPADDPGHHNPAGTVAANPLRERITERALADERLAMIAAANDHDTYLTSATTRIPEIVADVIFEHLDRDDSPDARRIVEQLHFIGDGRPALIEHVADIVWHHHNDPGPQFDNANYTNTVAPLDNSLFSGDASDLPGVSLPDSSTEITVVDERQFPAPQAAIDKSTTATALGWTAHSTTRHDAAIPAHELRLTSPGEPPRTILLTWLLDPGTEKFNFDRWRSGFVADGHLTPGLPLAKVTELFEQEQARNQMPALFDSDGSVAGELLTDRLPVPADRDTLDRESLGHPTPPTADDHTPPATADPAVSPADTGNLPLPGAGVDARNRSDAVTDRTQRPVKLTDVESGPITAETPAAESPSSGNDRWQPPAVAGQAWRHPGTITVPYSKHARASANLAALELLKQLESEQRAATPREQHEVLAAWSGWGAVQEIFDKRKPAWSVYRARLQELLDPEAYEIAMGSVLSAHYTDPAIAAAMWTVLQRAGFRGGHVLEPGAGSGTFIGLAPDNARMVGVEVDPATARIAHYLYPQAQVRLEGFETTPLPQDSFVAAVGNLPFGKFSLPDPLHNPAGHNIHNHFLIKSTALVAPGGYITVISSPWTMDATNTAVREEILESADFIAAVRLPGKTFGRVAGTAAIADIIVLRKREPGLDPFCDRPAAVAHRNRLFLDTALVDFPRTADTGDGQPQQIVQKLRISSWFQLRRQYVLGEMGIGHGLYGEGSLTVTNHQLDALPTQVVSILGQLVDTACEQDLGLTATADETVGEVLNTAGLVTYRPAAKFANPIGMMRYRGRFEAVTEFGSWEPVKVFATRAGETRALLDLRDHAYDVIIAQRSDDHNQTAQAQARADLNRVYDDYVRRYGPISRFKWQGGQERSQADHDARYARLEAQWRTGNGGEGGPYLDALPPEVAEELDTQAWQTSARVKKRPHLEGAISRDPTMAVVLALEHYSDATGAVRKSEIFTRDVAPQPVLPTHADNPGDALSISLACGRGVDVPYIAELLAVDPPTAAAQLVGHVFPDPDDVDHLIPANKYLSGNVREKLHAARAAAVENPLYEANVTALQAALPPQKEAAEIRVRAGSVWVSTDDHAQFVRETFGATNVQARREGVRWRFDATNLHNAKAMSWGVKSMNAVEIFEHACNSADIIVQYAGPDGTGIDLTATTAAQAQADRMRAEFVRWLWSDDDRRNRLVSEFNIRFNSSVPARWDGRFLHIPGLARIPYPYQLDAVMGILSEPVRLLDHVVGAGKTGTYVIGAMELRRRGMVSQPWIVVPNHLPEGIGLEARRWFPAAKILTIPSNLTAEQRRRAVAQTATSDWEIVIIAQSTFELIPVHPIRRQTYVRRALADLEDRVFHVKVDGDKRSLKDLMRAKKTMEIRLAKMLAADTKDLGLTFEQSGCDYLIVDEAHHYKNKSRIAAMRELSLPEGSGKAEDLSLKLELLRERALARAITRGLSPDVENMRIATLATGTRIANSLAEEWVMQNYMRPDLLEEAGVGDIGAWGSVFTTSKSVITTNPTGTKLIAKEKIAKFTNLGRMLAITMMFTDVVTRDQVPVGVTIAGGQRTIISTPASQEVRDFITDIDWRIEGFDASEPRRDNLLKAMNDARAAALDPKLAGLIGDTESSRARVVADEMLKDYAANCNNRYQAEDGAEHPIRGGLLIGFCDRGTPGGAGGEDNFYHTLRDLLVTGNDHFPGGIPLEKIRFAQDAKKPSERIQLQDDCNNGLTAVLLGSTEIMGTGLNVQTRAVALYHIDIAWRPADLEQREGRVLRQGNQNPTVIIKQFVTEGTTDAMMYGIVEEKARFIAQTKTGQPDIDEIDDLEDDLADAAAVAKAAATGDSRFIRMAELEQLVTALTALEKSAAETRYRASDTLKYNPISLSNAERDLETIERHLPAALAWTENPGILVVGGKHFTKRGEANLAFLSAAREAFLRLRRMQRKQTPMKIAEIDGHPIHVHTANDMLVFDIGGLGILRAVGSTDLFTAVKKDPASLDSGTTTTPSPAEMRAAESATARGLTQRISNAYEKLPELYRDLQTKISIYNSELEYARSVVDKPFERAEELVNARVELTQLRLAIETMRNSPEAIAAREAHRERMARQGRMPGWSLDLNPTAYTVKESGLETKENYVAMVRASHRAKAREYRQIHDHSDEVGAATADGDGTTQTMPPSGDTAGVPGPPPSEHTPPPPQTYSATAPLDADTRRRQMQRSIPPALSRTTKR